jgi:hypothetical protein
MLAKHHAVLISHVLPKKSQRKKQNSWHLANGFTDCGSGGAFRLEAGNKPHRYHQHFNLSWQSSDKSYVTALELAKIGLPSGKFKQGFAIWLRKVRPTKPQGRGQVGLSVTLIAHLFALMP